MNQQTQSSQVIDRLRDELADKVLNGCLVGDWHIVVGKFQVAGNAFVDDSLNDSLAVVFPVKQLD